MSLIIDCHGHYTVLPKAHDLWREEQKAAHRDGTECPPYPDIPDEDVRRTIEENQLRLIRERGADFTIFSPRASAMAPHVGDQAVASEWARRCNDLIYRVTQLFPDTFIGGCMLPEVGPVRKRERAASLRRGTELRGLQPQPGSGRRTFRAPPADR